MTYRNLLVQVDESRSCARRVELAVELAAAHDAHLTGVYIVSEPSPASFVHPYLPPDLTVSLQQEMRARADAALARFAEVAGRNQVAFETRVGMSSNFMKSTPAGAGVPKICGSR